MIIAIDGPSGAGKSSVGKSLARALGINYLDTGAMYRAVAYLVRERKLAAVQEDELAMIMQESALEFRFSDADTTVLLDNHDISEKLRSPDVSQEASRLSALSPVRRILVEMQRNICSTGDFVVEGRDIGSVVFPDAPCKFFLAASVLERAKRRHKQLMQQGTVIDLETIMADIETRDQRDINRADSPLVRTEDAIYIDSTEMGFAQVVNQMVAAIKKRKKCE